VLSCFVVVVVVVVYIGADCNWPPAVELSKQINKESNRIELLLLFFLIFGKTQNLSDMTCKILKIDMFATADL
jgi:hypothetical protein